MAPLFLTEREVEALLTVEEAVDAVQEALDLQALGLALNLPREQVPVAPGRYINTMRAYLPSLGIFGFKVYTIAAGRYVYHVYLYEAEAGRLLAILEAEGLGRLRTGAATAVAARYLAPPEPRVAAIIGSGYQARGQLEALAATFDLEEVRVYSREAERRNAFARQMGSRLRLKVAPVETAAQAIEGAQLVVTVTNSPTPVFDGTRLGPGVHVTAVGGAHPYVRELDAEAVTRADVVVVDDLDQARREAGELMEPASRGLLAWERVRPLWQVAAGQAPGRRGPRDITLFKSLGIALWDVAVARRVYEGAVARGLGRQL